MATTLEVIVCMSIVIISGVCGQTMDDIYRLHQDLLVQSNYSKHIRPFTDATQPTEVQMQFDLISIRELDEILGKLSVVGILWMVWQDPRITWNPANYGNAMSVRLEMKEMWKPDLIIAHPIESVSAVGHDHYHYPVRVLANGVALWAPGDVMTTTCKIDVAYYPFDTQTCEIQFIPWGMRLNEIFLNASVREISTRYFVGHGEWELTNSYAHEGLIDEVYPTYNVVLELKRRPTFIIVNVVMPILFMGLLNVLVFFLPAQSGERISFSMTVLLAIAVFLTLVGDNMPKTSEPMSTICYFLLTNLVLSSVIMIVTILNLNVYYRSDLIPVPTWLTNIVLCLTCKRSRKTKVENMPEVSEEDDIPEIVLKKGKGDYVIDALKKEKDGFVGDPKWAAPADDEANHITWKDVSRLFDKIFGTLALVWLLFSAAAFFGMVSTQSVPGVDS